MTGRNVPDSYQRALLAPVVWVANRLVECLGVGTALAVASFLVSRTQVPFWIGVALGAGGFALLSAAVAAYAITEAPRRWYLLCAAALAAGGVLFVLPGAVRPQGGLYGVAAFLGLSGVFAWWRAGHRAQP